MEVSRKLILTIVFILIFLFQNYSLGKVITKTNFPILSPSRHLNYPDIPEDIKKKFNTSSVKKKIAAINYDKKISSDWALTNIGYFEAFTPLFQPIKPTISKCSHSIVVAVIDTGIDYTHDELKESIWINKGEVGPWEGPESLKKLGFSCRDKSCNGIDDDGNGFIDDVIGWDFVNDVPLPYDTHGHGSHISGIIGASAGNGVGSGGVCPGVSIMALKYYDNSGTSFNNLTNTVRAIKYAVANGAHIINYSGGGSEPSFAEKSAIEDARKEGVLFIAAAGNEGKNNIVVPYYPASYPLDNIISVASLNRENMLLSSSNYGKNVHIAAPGLLIVSTLPNNKFGSMSGTSQATAFVSGAAALIASQLKDDPRKHYKEIKKWIMDGAIKDSNKELPVLGGMLSLSNSLKLIEKVSEIAQAPNNKHKKKSPYNIKIR